MSDDSGDDGPEDLSDKEIEIVEGGGIRFGDYSVVSPGVQIILGGRPVSHPGE